MGHHEEIEQIKREMAQCRTSVYDEIEKIKIALRNQSEERKSFNSEINNKIDSVIKRFDTHDEEEMKKYDAIIDKLGDLVGELKTLNEKTEDNTDFIEKIKKSWGRILLMSTTSIATIGGMYWLYTILQNHGLVIMFEMAK